MKFNQTNLPLLVQLASVAGYHEENKASFKKQSMAALRAIAKELRLDSNDYSIRYNAGGIAVSGEAILHHNLFYLQISDGGIYWRTCKGQKDYTGGSNCWAVGFGRQISASQLVTEINRACFSYVRRAASEAYPSAEVGVGSWAQYEQAWSCRD
jgi:hypothetical protein